MKTRKFSFFLYCFGLALLTGFSSDISIEDLSKKDKKAIVKDYGKTIRSKTKHAERHRGLVAKWKKKDLLEKLGIKRKVTFALNDEHDLDEKQQLKDGDEVLVFTSVGGG